jgi:hypothetical protein
VQPVEVLCDFEQAREQVFREHRGQVYLEGFEQSEQIIGVDMVEVLASVGSDGEEGVGR